MSPHHSPRDRLRQIFDAMVRRATPSEFLADHLPQAPRGKTIVVGAGKAAASMAAAFDRLWPLELPLTGVVVTPYGYSQPRSRIDVIEAAHPVPDENSVAAADAIIGAIRSARPADLVVCLISGGGSAVMCKPAPGLSLHDKQAVHQILVRSGVPIARMNLIRRRLSAVKGGRLPLFAPGVRWHSLIMSDVPEDDLAAIASGPTVPDDATLRDALDVVRAYQLELPRAAVAALEDPMNETVRPGDDRLALVSNHLVLTPRVALDAAHAAAVSAGYEVLDLGANVEGDAAELGQQHGRLALEKRDLGRPICILSGGETTVKLPDSHGRGGRNTHYLLSLAVALDGASGIHALAADTDGIDGSEANAGAMIGPEFLRRLKQAGGDARSLLRHADAYTAFEATGDLLVTGPTGTNVNDCRAILIDP